MSINYDFSELSDLPDNDPGTGEDERPFFRVAKCCSNCKYFIYNTNHMRRGWCKRSSPNTAGEPEVGQFSKGVENLAARRNWPKVFLTNTCENWTMRTPRNFKGLPEDWTRENYDISGNVVSYKSDDEMED